MVFLIDTTLQFTFLDTSKQLRYYNLYPVQAPFTF